MYLTQQTLALIALNFIGMESFRIFKILLFFPLRVIMLLCSAFVSDFHGGAGFSRMNMSQLLFI